MKKQLKWFIAGIIVCSIFLAIPWAGGVTKKLKEVFIKSEDITTVLSPEKFKPEYFCESDLAIYDSVTNKEIKLFMTKNEIDKILGTKGKATENAYMYNYFGLNVYYRDNLTAVFLDLKSNETKRYSTVRKIALGDTKSDIIKLYGDFLGSDKNLDSADYFIENRNGLYYYLKYATSLDKSKFEKFDKDKTCIITFYFNGNDINRISIYEFRFGLELK